LARVASPPEMTVGDWAFFTWNRLRLMRNLAGNRGIFAQEHREKRPRPMLHSRGPGPNVGALGNIEDARDCPEETPMLLRLATVARRV
jgi:hypothetical protein